VSGVRASESTTNRTLRWLGAGDTIFFRGDLPHSYENPGKEPGVAHLVMQYAAHGD
jgi:hypothetical protein